MLVNVGRKSFSNRTSLSAVIDSTHDFQNSYTYNALNRLRIVRELSGIGLQPVDRLEAYPTIQIRQ